MDYFSIVLSNSSPSRTPRCEGFVASFLSLRRTSLSPRRLNLSNEKKKSPAPYKLSHWSLVLPGSPFRSKQTLTVTLSNAMLILIVFYLSSLIGCNFSLYFLTMYFFLHLHSQLVRINGMHAITISTTAI